MFLLPGLLIGLALAVALGGKPGRLASVSFRQSWTVFLALGIQLVVFVKLGQSLPPAAAHALHVASYALLLLFGLANIRMRALLPLLGGVTLNAIAIAANGGEMPISRSAMRAAGISDPGGSNVSLSADHLRFLGDIFALPAGLHAARVFSLGDLLIAVGVVAFIVLTSLERSEAPLRVSRLVEPLRIAPFRHLAAGRFISSVGDWLTIAALIGWIYHSTGSTSSVAVLLLVRLVPPILGGSVAAMIVDRLPKTRLLMWIEVLRGLAVGLAIASVIDGHRIGVYVALAVSGALAAMSNAAVPALLPSLLPAERLASANAGLGLAKDGAMAIGAVGAGVALSLVGVTWALVADLATFAAAFVLYSGLPSWAGYAQGGDDGRPARGGLRYMLGRRPLLILVLSFGAATVATGLTNASLPRFLEGEVGFGSGGYGFGIAALATGLALGQALVGLTRVGPTAGRWIGIGLLIMASLFVLLGLSDHAPTVLLLIGLIGFVDGTTDVLFETAVQREADPRHLGAVFGFASAFITTTMMSAVAVAPLANRLLAPHGVIVGTSIFLIAAGLIALVGMAGHGKRREEEPEQLTGTRILRGGIDVSIITYDALAEAASDAVRELDGDHSVEIVVAPGFDDWDPAVVHASVEKTSKVLVLHDNSGNEMLAAELAATIAEECFHHLDAPVRRVCAPDEDLAARLRELAEF